MTDKAVFTALAEILEVPNEGPDSDFNPYLTKARFVFADDKGAPVSTGGGRLQGIEVDDFDEVIKTAMHMPIKMNLIGGNAVGTHSGSYVIGHIIDMEKVSEGDSNKLIAEAVLYKEEYPEEVRFLKEKYDANEAPGISYELAYASSVVKNGVEWLKNLITCAATFVRSPAYGTRTQLLALASAQTDEEFLSTMKTLVAQAEGLDEGNTTPSIEGGNNVDELEKVQQENETLKAQAATKTSELASLTDELNALKEQLSTANQTIATLENDKLIETRTRKFAEAGFMLSADAEKADKKKALWLSLSDEAFDEYLADLSDAKAMAASKEDPKKAEASAWRAIPRPDASSDDSGEVPSFKFR